MSDLRFIKIEPLPKPEKRPSRFSAFLLWLIAAAGLIVSSLAVLPLGGLLAGMNPQMQTLATDILFYLPFVALPVILLTRREPGLAEAYRPNPISLLNVSLVAILAFVVLFMVNDITVLWSIPFQKLGLDIYSSGLAVPATRGELVLSILAVAVIPAVCEEFLFRGVILSALERYGTRHAVLLSSLLFALLHGSIVGAPAQFILGVILALLVFWTDSIYAGLIYHTVHNALAVILDYLQAQTPETAAATDDLLQAIGGLTGLLDLSLGILCSAAVVLMFVRIFSMRGRLRGVTMEPRRREYLRRSEILVLLGGLALCALLYGLDVLWMMGGV